MDEDGKIRVFLLDDHEVVRRGVHELLAGEGDIEVVGEAGTAADALARIPAACPDVAVLDVRLPDGSGVEVCRDIRSGDESVRCLVLTSFADDEALFDAIMAGAGGREPARPALPGLRPAHRGRGRDPAAHAPQLRLLPGLRGLRRRVRLRQPGRLGAGEEDAWSVQVVGRCEAYEPTAAELERFGPPPRTVDGEPYDPVYRRLEPRFSSVHMANGFPERHFRDAV